VVDGRSYRVVRTSSPRPWRTAPTTSSCIGNTGSARQMYKRVSTRVETAFRGGRQPVRADTLVKAPVFDPNSARARSPGRHGPHRGTAAERCPVSLASTNLTTDANGCPSSTRCCPVTHTAYRHQVRVGEDRRQHRLSKM
jgi:hypothetical protein